MLSYSSVTLRYRTAWRELLHPLPIRARHMEWFKRDTVEQNEAALRRPYYSIKSFALPPATGPAPPGLHGSSDVDAALRQPRHVTSLDRLRELRADLQFPGAAGPAVVAAGNSFEEDYGTRLRPRYPESWDTVPPHQPSRNPL